MKALELFSYALGLGAIYFVSYIILVGTGAQY